MHGVRVVATVGQRASLPQVEHAGGPGSRASRPRGDPIRLGRRRDTAPDTPQSSSRRRV
jgi:hypothetical protein